MSNQGSSKFTEVLLQQPTEVLRAIVDSRGFAFNRPISDKATLALVLSSALSDRNQLFRARQGLDAAELHLMERLSAQNREIVAGDEIRASFPKGMPVEEAEFVAQRLMFSGLLLGWDEGSYYLPRPASSMFRSLNRSLRLRPCLESLTPEQLKTVVEALDMEVSPKARRFELMESAYAGLTDKGRVDRVRNGLDAETAQVLGRLLMDDLVPIRKILPLLTPSQRERVRRDWYWSPYHSALEAEGNPTMTLQRLGLAYTPSHYMTDPCLGIPEEIKACLPVPAPRSVAHFMLPQLREPPESTPFSTHKTLLSDVVRILVFLEQDRPEQLKSGGFPKQALRKLTQRVSAPDPLYVSFLLALVFTLDLAREHEGRFLPTKEADAWLALDRCQQVRMLCHGWTSSCIWSEQRVDSFDFSYYGVLPGMPLRRALIDFCDSLPETALTADCLRESMEFLLPLAIESLKVDVEDWQPAFERLLKAAHWLGVVDVSFPEMSAVRKGWALPVLFETQARQDATGFVVQPNLEIVAPPDLQPEIFRRLLRFSEGPALDGASVLRLTQASVRSGLDGGLSAAGIVQFLEKHAEKTVPQTVVHFLKDVEAQYRQLEFGPAELYVKASRPELLREILDIKALRGMVRPLSDTVGLVDKRNEAKVLAALRSAGRLPFVNDGRPHVAPQRGRMPSIASAGSVDGGFDPEWESMIQQERQIEQRGRTARGEKKGGTATAPEEGVAAGQAQSEEASHFLQHELLEIRYRNAKGGVSTRLVEPSRVDDGELLAYCHLARAEMRFKVDNIIWFRPVDAVHA